MKTFLKKTIALACFAMLMPLSLLAQDVLKVHGIVTDPRRLYPFGSGISGRL